MKEQSHVKEILDEIMKLKDNCKDDILNKTKRDFDKYEYIPYGFPLNFKNVDKE